MTVLDRVVSSYASSLKSFVLGRRQKQTTIAHSGRKALLVGVGDAQYMPRLTPLPFVAREIDQIEKICASFKLESTTLKEPITRQVLDNMDGCAIFHFAGHGRVDPLEPSQSGIVMRDGLLTVANLMDAKLQSKPPFLAFLSACLSGANDVIELQDEGVHLISACQLLGFRHVIGTQWQVSDSTCVDVSEALYTGLAKSGMADDSVCRSLHRALVDLRDHWVKTGQSSIRGGFDSQSES
ncbi:CHAT domain-containing protein [Ilyonectria robusta]|uniref:CHAT domain-containing protein n=1 Tax=Ilyonectria robusta TaxID=1079257 RepID=UPI001E8D6699|nr:CHAT domain-containing protein [Ilyonectria robusta]KAH8664752.1 CHAT domain-containing protein [Ilyonectria robusta]